MTTEYAFILTGQYPNGGAFTFHGTFNATPGMTRTAALGDIMTAAKERYSIPDTAPPNILFFSLEPNRLGGA